MPNEITLSEAKPKSTLKRFLPLIIIAIALSLFFALGGPEYISLEYLKEERARLTASVEENLVLALGGFIMLYAVLTGISFPGASLLSIWHCSGWKRYCYRCNDWRDSDFSGRAICGW